MQEVQLKQAAAPNVKGHVPGQIIRHRGALEHLAGGGGQWMIPHQIELADRLCYSWLGQ